MRFNFEHAIQTSLHLVFRGIPIERGGLMAYMQGVGFEAAKAFD